MAEMNPTDRFDGAKYVIPLIEDSVKFQRRNPIRICTTKRHKQLCTLPHDIIASS